MWAVWAVWAGWAASAASAVSAASAAVSVVLPPGEEVWGLFSKLNKIGLKIKSDEKSHTKQSSTMST